MRRVAIAFALLSSWFALPAYGQLLSPGPLSNAHRSIDGDDHCSKCHSEGKRVSASKCLSCHGDLDRRIRAGKGLHGRKYRGQACEHCHVDHLGRSASLIRWPGKNRNNFPHIDTGWPLKGLHTRVGCDRCHDKRNSRGAKTYLGLASECASCHKDPHEGRLGATCSSCHSEAGWKRVNLKAFDHDRARFKLRGSHKTVECEKCHKGTPVKWAPLKFGDCDSCHQDPHRGRFKRQKCSSCHTESSWENDSGFRRNHPGLSLARGHSKVRCEQCHDQGNTKPPRKGKACVACHSPVHRADFGRGCKKCHAKILWVGLPPEVGRTNHGKTRYPLEGQHTNVDCERCHKRAVPVAKRYRDLAFSRCDGCHSDSHKGEFAALDNGECSRCHSVRGFAPTSFGVELHAKTVFPLDGRHVSTPCAGCHEATRPRLSWKQPKRKCEQCHDNPHGDQFAKEMTAGGCAHCHNTGGWSRPNINHSIWPLEGAHARTDCDACHSPSQADRAKGAGATYRGVPRECDGCHKDTHAGQFRLTTPVRACEYCHSPKGFEIAAFDHEAKAGYALTGSHAKVECAKCHPKTALRNGTESVRYRLGYRACKDCHKNPHP